MVSFILIKIKYAKNTKKMPKITIWGLFLLINSSKQPIEALFDTKESP